MRTCYFAVYMTCVLILCDRFKFIYTVQQPSIREMTSAVNTWNLWHNCIRHNQAKYNIFYRTKSTLKCTSALTIPSIIKSPFLSITGKWYNTLYRSLIYTTASEKLLSREHTFQTEGLIQAISFIIAALFSFSKAQNLESNGWRRAAIELQPSSGFTWAVSRSEGREVWTTSPLRAGGWWSWRRSRCSGTIPVCSGSSAPCRRSSQRSWGV